MTSLISNIATAFLVVAALAGCAATGNQESWFDYVDRTSAYNAAD